MRNDAAEELVTIYVTRRDGQSQTVQARRGDPLMIALSEQETGVEAVCGGCLSCATCHIYFDPEQVTALPPADEAETDLISGLLNARQTSRLSCQIEVTAELDRIAIEIAPPEA